MDNGRKPADFFKTLQKVEEVLAEVELTTTADEDYKAEVRAAILRKILEQVTDES